MGSSIHQIMNRLVVFIFLFTLSCPQIIAQNQIPLDTVHWDINSKAYVLEEYGGNDAIYIQGGGITLKDEKFLNGTIEFEVFLKRDQEFPGVSFRIDENSNAEQYYIAVHC